MIARMNVFVETVTSYFNLYGKKHKNIVVGLISHTSINYKIYSLAFFTICRCTKISQHNQLPVASITQLVEHCTSISEVMGFNPVSPSLNFLKAQLLHLL